MLSLMRKNAGSWLIKIILFVIVIVFAFWGVGSYSEMRRNRVATVGNYTVTLRDFDSAYRSLLQQVQFNVPNEQMTEEFMQSLQLEKNALSQLINREVLLQAAAKFKLVVSDNELRDSIYAMQVFHDENGQFDGNRYLAIINQMQVSNEAFEEMQRFDLLINKLTDLVVSDVKVSDAEAEEWYEMLNRRTSGKYVEFLPAVYFVSVSDEEIQTYYDNHRELYMSQPMRKVAYARFAPEDYLQTIELNDAELEELYENNLDLYSTPDLLDLRQIVVAIEQPGDEVSEAEAKAKIEAAAVKLAEGLDFSEVVKEYSELIFQENDGRGTDIPKSDFIAYFGEDQASLAAGEVTAPIRTDWAWYIFKFDAVKSATVKTFEEVKDALKEEIALNAARNQAYDDADDVSAAAFAGEELAAAAGSKGVTAVTTDYFDRGSLVNSLNLIQRSAFTSFVFDHEVGDVSDAHEFEGDYYVVVILDEKAPELIPLEEVKIVVEQAVRLEKQTAQATADARELIKAVQQGRSLEDAAKDYDFEVKSTGLITRYDYVMDFAIPGSPAQEALFTLSTSNPVFAEPLPGPMVLVYEDSAPADMENFAQESAGIKMQLLQEKRNVVFDKYLRDQKQKAKIWVAESFQQFYDPAI